jgi:hypothetical protein
MEEGKNPKNFNKRLNKRIKQKQKLLLLSLQKKIKIIKLSRGRNL